MRRRLQWVWVWLTCAATLSSGCAPTQPFFFHEDGDLSHYKDVATEIEFPDVCQPPLADAASSLAPLSIRNFDDLAPWELTLDEAVHTALANSKVIRQVNTSAISPVVPQPDSILRSPDAFPTIYDPAIQESNPTTGVEGALSDFDAQLASSVLWERNERPVNVGGIGDAIFARNFQQDRGTFQAQLSKTAATGSTFSLANNTVYDFNNNPTRGIPSDWTTNVEAQVTQPLLQGAGTQFNRIAGPNSSIQNRFFTGFNGVVIARINNDIALADFEAQVWNQLSDVENTYRELYFAYRDLDARKRGRDAALETWQRVNARLQVGGEGGGALDEARARQQYYLFRAQVEDGQTSVFEVESRLRYLMGLAASDGRLVRPIDEPTTAKVDFDWPSVHGEALTRHVNLRRQKWRIKQRELEVVASKNFLLPRLDVVATYRWLGLGDDLIDANGQPVSDGLVGSDAFATLTSGDYQEWAAGLQFQMPIGFRRELASVRHQQLLLARERAILEDQELEVTHLLSDAIRNLYSNYALVQTNFNRRLAAEDELDAAQTVVDVGGVQGVDALDQLLQAQRNLAEAESAYYRSLVDYNKAITEVHYRKGSLLEYNNVLLAEGPWPEKAYCDAHERARERDAGAYIDYGYTRPRVFSQGPYPQFQQPGGELLEDGYEQVEGVPTPAVEPDGDVAEPTPMPAEDLPPPESGAAAGLRQPGAGGVVRSAAVQATFVERDADDSASDEGQEHDRAHGQRHDEALSAQPAGEAAGRPARWQRAQR